MKSRYRKAAVIAGIFLGVQVLGFLFSDTSSLTVLFSIAVPILYLVNTGDIKVEEGAAGAAGFLLSSFALSSIGKIFFLDGLCETARSAAGIESGPAVLNPDQVCQGFFEAWVRTLTTNPAYNWYFWVGTFGTAALSGYAYRRYMK